MSKTSTPTSRCPTPNRPGDGLRILGVDPGSRITGWGLVGGASGRPRLLDCGRIRLVSAPTLPARLALLQRELTELLAVLGPLSAAVESPFHGKDARASLQLAHARGVILAVLADSGIDVHEYTPATVKKAVTGNGRAPKDQVQRMVRLMLRAPEIPASSDVSDALAVALCHAASAGFHRALARACGPRAASRPGG